MATVFWGPTATVKPKKSKQTRSNYDVDEYDSPSASPPHEYSGLQYNGRSNGYSTYLPNDPIVEDAKQTSASSNMSTEKSDEPQVKTRVDSPETTVKEIEEDKREAQQVIANFGVDPVEILHMVERWTQTLLADFNSLKFSFKHVLRSKWEHAELKINADHRRRRKELYEHVQELKKALDKHLSKECFDNLRSFVSSIDHHTNTTELKEKVSSVIDTYMAIFRSLESVEQHQQTSNDSSYASAKAVLEQLRLLNQKSSHSICIIGLEKCGKSTFVNALLGFELLPAASERCTQIRTVLKPTLPEDVTLFARVEFHNHTTFQNLVKQMVAKSDEEPQAFEQRKRDVLQEQQRLLAKFPERQEIFKLTGTNQDAKKQREDIIKVLHNYIASELYVNIIQEIAIYTDKLPGKNYEISDVPGFDSPIKEHRDAGLQAIKSADAFLFLTDGNRPDLTRDQIRLLNEIQGGKHYEAMKRAFGVITRLDQCHTPINFKEISTKARNKLLEKGFRDNHIFHVCSVLKLLPPSSDEYQAITQKVKNFDGLENGFKLCQDSLNRFIEFELPRTHLNQLLEFGATKLARYVNECLNDIKRDASLSQMLLGNQGSDDHMKEQDDQEWDKIYQEELFQPAFDEANIWQKQVLTEQRAQFMKDTKALFHDRFMISTKAFIDQPVDVKGRMMKQYTYTVLHMTSQPIDNQIREKLSFELESIVLQTTNMLARHLYDEYISQLETILNKISPTENDVIYHSQKLSFDICSYELRAMVLRVCRPIITATLRFSHSDEKCRRSAIDELILIAPTIVCHLCETNENESNTSWASQIASWAPTLKKGIEMALDVYGKTGIQNKITATIFQFVLKKIL